jgi:hypothetical protein
MNSHVSAPAFWRDGKLVLADATLFVHQLKRAKFGSGEALVVRVEREEDAYVYGALKHYWGHLVTPVSEFTGYTKHEAHAMFKALFLPDGMKSLTECNRDQMRAFTESVEQHIREEIPEAFEDGRQRALA